MPSKELTTEVREKLEALAQGQITGAQLEVLKNTLAEGTSDEEFALFVATAVSLGLNPLVKQIQSIRFKKGAAAQPYITWEGLQAIAERTGEFEGFAGPPLFTADGETWTEVWLEDTPPAAAKVGVWRKGYREPVWAVCRWQSYARTYYRDGKPVLMETWAQMPDVMLAKAALRLALRRAFPYHMPGNDRFREAGEPEDGAEPQVDEPATRRQMTALHTVAGMLGWTDDERHERAGVESFKDLTVHAAAEILDEWQELLEAQQQQEDVVDGEIVGEGETTADSPQDTSDEESSGAASDSPEIDVPPEDESGVPPSPPAPDSGEGAGSDEAPTYPNLAALPKEIREEIEAIFDPRLSLADKMVAGFAKGKKKQVSELEKGELGELLNIAQSR